MSDEENLKAVTMFVYVMQALGFLFGNDGQLLRFLYGSVMKFLRAFFNFNDLLNLFLVHNSLLTEWSLIPWTIWTQL